MPMFSDVYDSILHRNIVWDNNWDMTGNTGMSYETPLDMAAMVVVTQFVSPIAGLIGTCSRMKQAWECRTTLFNRLN